MSEHKSKTELEAIAEKAVGAALDVIVTEIPEKDRACCAANAGALACAVLLSGFVGAFPEHRETTMRVFRSAFAECDSESPSEEN